MTEQHLNFVSWEIYFVEIAIRYSYYKYMILDKEKIIEIINEHRKELEEKYKIKAIALFGSYVRNEQTEKSDIDLLVEYNSLISLLHLAATQIYLSDILGVKVDIVPKEDIREELKEIILNEAVAI
jgi:predicted nucleotidyltransferase